MLGKQRRVAHKSRSELHMSDVPALTPLFVTQLAACTSIIGMGAYVESKSESNVEIEECIVNDKKLLGEGRYLIFILITTY